MERQPQVSSLQVLSTSLLVKGHGEDYIEAEEKVHVIQKKLKQLREQVSQDLMSLQGSQVSPRVAFSRLRGRQEGRVVALLWRGGREKAGGLSGVAMKVAEGPRMCSVT